MSEFRLTSYTWRGKTYKTIRGLMRAVTTRYPRNQGITFERDRMIVYADRIGDPARRAWIFPRTLDGDGNSTIADQPAAGPA